MLLVLVPMGLHLGGVDLPGDRAEDHGPWTYYVSPDGNDKHDGRSPARAWQTLRNVEAVVFHPGDRLLLRGSARYQGTVRFGPADAGNPADPVTVGSYGTGRATLAPVGDSGIIVYDTAGVEVRDVAVAGNPVAYAHTPGIRIFTDLPGGRKLDHITVSGVDVSGFKVGIEIGGGTGGTGFRDVTVSDARLHGNRDAGLFSFGPTVNPSAPAYAHERVTISNVEAYGNPGDPADHERATGSGIVLGSVRGGTVRYSSAHDNGAKCDAITGPVGIWAYDSARLVIEHNISYSNQRGGRADGGGFDFDRNVASSTMQYNLSYGNDGPGYLIFSDKTGHIGNTVRFNISHDDARKPGNYAAMYVVGRITKDQIYQNTVLVHASEAGRPPALIVGGPLRGVTLRNNIFMAVGTPVLRALASLGRDRVTLQGNDLYSESYPWQVIWGTREFFDFDAWRNATDQEQNSDGPTGLSVTPDFAYPRAQDTAGVARAAGFTPSVGSPLVGAGLGLGTLGVDPGPVDYFGVPLAGRPVTIGAAQPVHR